MKIRQFLKFCFFGRFLKIHFWFASDILILVGSKITMKLYACNEKSFFRRLFQNQFFKSASKIKTLSKLLLLMNFTVCHKKKKIKIPSVPCRILKWLGNKCHIESILIKPCKPLFLLKKSNLQIDISCSACAFCPFGQLVVVA